MARLSLTLLLLLTFPVFGQTWSEEPAEFRRIPFGANEAAVRMSLKSPKCLSGTEPGERLCSDIRSTVIGDVSTSESYLLDQDVFVAAHLQFDSSDYDYLRDVFTERYGAPHSTARSPVKTIGGAALENETLTWRGTTAVVTITRYSDKVTEGNAVVATRAWYEKVAAAGESKKRKAARSF